MSSQINPNSINQSYPVAGVDNNSQGFRDNFTAIKNNFVVTRREMDDLISKAVVKSALTYGPGGINNNFNGEEINNAVFVKCSNAINDLTTLTTGADVALDFSLGSFHKVTLNGTSVNSNITFANWVTDSYAEIRLRVTVSSTTHTLTVPASVTHYTNSLNIISSSIITFVSTGVYDFVFSSTDGGTTILISDYIKYTAV